VPGPILIASNANAYPTAKPGGLVLGSAVGSLVNDASPLIWASELLMTRADFDQVHDRCNPAFADSARLLYDMLAREGVVRTFRPEEVMADELRDRTLRRASEYHEDLAARPDDILRTESGEWPVCEVALGGLLASLSMSELLDAPCLLSKGHNAIFLEIMSRQLGSEGEVAGESFPDTVRQVYEVFLPRLDPVNDFSILCGSDDCQSIGNCAS